MKKQIPLLRSLFCLIGMLNMCQNHADPLPYEGQNIWHVAAEIGTDVDLLISKLDECCLGTFTVIASLEACDSTPLFQSTFDASGGTLALTATGQSYCLAQNITGNIIVSASDVTVDLNMHSLIGTFSILETALRSTIKNGNIKPEAPANNIDTENAAITIAAGADTALISDCYIICSPNTILIGGNNALNGRPGINNNALDCHIRSCFIQSGDAADGNSSFALPNGGNGGTGIITTGNRTEITQCTIITGSGGMGDEVSAGNSGNGGNGGDGIITTGQDCKIVNCNVTTGKGSIGGTTVSFNGGNGGNGGNGIVLSGINCQILECFIITGSGASGDVLAGNGSNGGNGGDGIDATGSNLEITRCSIITGTGGDGGSNFIPLTGGAGGNGGNGINTSGFATAILECLIITNSGGAGGAGVTGGNGGNGGTAINHSGNNGTFIDNIIEKIGGGGVGGSGAPTGTAGLDGNGITLGTLTNMVIENGTIFGGSIGISISGTIDLIIKNVKIASSTSMGISILDASANCLIKNCEALGIASIGFNVAGTSTDIVFEECIGDVNATGFSIGGTATDIILKECTARGNTTGFSLVTASAASVTSLLGCTAQKNTSFGFNAVTSSGKGLIKQCHAIGNGGAAGTGGFNDKGGTASLYRYVSNSSEGNGATPAGAADTNYTTAGVGTAYTPATGLSAVPPYIQRGRIAGTGAFPTISYWDNITLL